MAVITSRCGGCRRPWRAARRAARRRTGAARRRPPGRGRRNCDVAPGAGRACRPRCRPRPTPRVQRRPSGPAAPCEPVSSATRVACSAPSSSPARPSGPSSSLIDRWCCWASTSVGASSTACRPRRRPGASRAAPRPSCPSRPRPAAAGASDGRGQLGGDLRPGFLLARGQRERQPRVERLEQAAAARDPRRGRQRVLRPAPLGQRRPAARTPRPTSAAAGPLHVGEVHRAVDGVQGLAWRGSRCRSRTSAGSGSSSTSSVSSTVRTALAIFQDGRLAVAG